jgi:hypothetical protein
MNAIPSSIDTGSKRWLIVLGAAVLVSVVILARSFVSTLFPSKEVTVAVSASARTEETVTRTEPDWNSAHAVQTGPVTQTPASKPDPFAAKYAAEAKAAAAHDPVAHQQAVHQQAEYLRNLISQGKPTPGFGKLTNEQVNQMEQKGILIQ